MSNRVPCKICGADILPDTAHRTGGLCMQCSKDPTGRSARIPPPPPPAEELLSRLRTILGPVILGAARRASCNFETEEIYGFALYHGQFLYVGVTVFTEAGLDAKVKEYKTKGHFTTRERLRWSPCDSPHHMVFPDLLSEIEDIFVQLDRHTKIDFSADIERIFLECLDAVWNAHVFSSKTVIALMEGDQSDESRFAYAERFNAPETLMRFRSELTDLDQQTLAHCRAGMRSSR